MQSPILTSDLLCSVGEKQPTILKWRILTTTSDLERVSTMALPKLPISTSNTDLKVASDTKFFPGLGEQTEQNHLPETIS